MIKQLFMIVCYLLFIYILYCLFSSLFTIKEGFSIGVESDIPITFFGGWSNSTESATWRTTWGCNTILIGPFKGNRPPMLCESDSYTNIFYTIGGDGVESNMIKLDETLIETAVSYYTGSAGTVNGICFDIESGLSIDDAREKVQHVWRNQASRKLFYQDQFWLFHAGP